MVQRFNRELLSSKAASTASRLKQPGCRFFKQCSHVATSWRILEVVQRRTPSHQQTFVTWRLVTVSKYGQKARAATPIISMIGKGETLEFTPHCCSRYRADERIASATWCVLLPSLRKRSPMPIRPLSKAPIHCWYRFFWLAATVDPIRQLRQFPML